MDTAASVDLFQPQAPQASAYHEKQRRDVVAIAFSHAYFELFDDRGPKILDLYDDNATIVWRGRDSEDFFEAEGRESIKDLLFQKLHSEGGTTDLNLYECQRIDETLTLVFWRGVYRIKDSSGSDRPFVHTMVIKQTPPHTFRIVNQLVVFIDCDLPRKSETSFVQPYAAHEEITIEEHAMNCEQSGIDDSSASISREPQELQQQDGEADTQPDTPSQAEITDATHEVYPSEAPQQQADDSAAKLTESVTPPQQSWNIPPEGTAPPQMGSDPTPAQAAVQQSTVVAPSNAAGPASAAPGSSPAPSKRPPPQQPIDKFSYAGKLMYNWPSQAPSEQTLPVSRQRGFALPGAARNEPTEAATNPELSKQKRKLFMPNCPVDMSEEQIKKAVQDQLETMTGGSMIRLERSNKGPRHHAKLEMTDERSAEMLAQKGYIYLKGNKHYVNRFNPQPERPSYHQKHWDGGRDGGRGSSSSSSSSTGLSRGDGGAHNSGQQGMSGSRGGMMVRQNR